MELKILADFPKDFLYFNNLDKDVRDMYVYLEICFFSILDENFSKMKKIRKIMIQKFILP